MMALVSAPSNLGLRPPQPTSVPGCAKAPEALREAGLFQRLGEFGAVVDSRGGDLCGRCRTQFVSTGVEPKLAASHGGISNWEINKRTNDTRPIAPDSPC